MIKKLLSKHLQKLASKSEAVKNQFVEKDEEDPLGKSFFLSDPLEEEHFAKTKGLIHKYSNRVLILLTLQCAAYCRFCTRQRCVSDIKKGRLITKDFLLMKKYILKHPAVKEVIISGGDPFTVPDTLISGLKLFSSLAQIKIIRIGTRAPVSCPSLVNSKLLKAFGKVKQPLYVLIHFEHPDELTKETIKVIYALRKAGAILFSQTVFLKGINDSFTVLYKLFSLLVEYGVKPYYLFRCDPVLGAEKFRVDYKKEIEIATALRKNLSGLACPVYAIDAPGGSGKIPVPLGFWEFKKEIYKDFLDKKIEVI